jgi:hypothetical protein
VTWLLKLAAVDMLKYKSDFSSGNDKTKILKILSEYRGMTVLSVIT